MNSDFRDANIQAILGSYSEVVTDGDPVLKSGAGTAFGRAWEASNRAKAGFSLVEILGQKDRGRRRELGPPGEAVGASVGALCASLRAWAVATKASYPWATSEVLWLRNSHVSTRGG